MGLKLWGKHQRGDTVFFYSGETQIYSKKRWVGMGIVALQRLLTSLSFNQGEGWMLPPGGAWVGCQGRITSSMAIKLDR